MQIYEKSIQTLCSDSYWVRFKAQPLKDTDKPNAKTLVLAVVIISLESKPSFQSEVLNNPK